MNVLHLTLKKKWFDMIDSGEKTEEYREIKPYWFMRLVFKPEKVLSYCGHPEMPTNQYSVNSVLKNNKQFVAYRPFDLIVFVNGYSKNARKITIECLGIETGEAKPEWSDNWKGDVFIIKLGKKIS